MVEALLKMKKRKSEIQVLAVTMHQTDHSLLEKMNIRTDALVGNQCDRNEIESFSWNGHEIRYYSLQERGVGLNRATLLDRADADIVLFADDDVVYCDDYPEKIRRVYAEHPDADVIIFNMRVSRGGEETHDIVSSDRFVGRRGVSSFGMFCVSAKRESLRMAGISFHLMFGGGARFSCGEDTIFLQDCVKKGLKVYTSTETIGKVNHGDSTWFHGYTDKFFFDKGALYATIYPHLAYALSVYHCVKHSELYGEYGVWTAIRKMHEGVRFIRRKGCRSVQNE